MICLVLHFVYLVCMHIMMYYWLMYNSESISKKPVEYIKPLLFNYSKKGAVASFPGLGTRLRVQEIFCRPDCMTYTQIGEETLRNYFILQLPPFLIGLYYI